MSSDKNRASEVDIGHSLIEVAPPSTTATKQGVFPGESVITRSEEYPTPAELLQSDRTRKAKTAYQLAGQSTVTAAFHHVRVGLELLDIRSDFNYGRWIEYLDREWSRVSPRTIQRYLEVARLWPLLRAGLAKQSPNNAKTLAHSEPEAFVERIAQGEEFDFQSVLERLKASQATRKKKKRGKRSALHQWLEKTAFHTRLWGNGAYFVASPDSRSANDDATATSASSFEGSWSGRVVVLISRINDADRWITKTLEEYDSRNIDEAIVVAPADFRDEAINELLHYPIAICRLARAKKALTRSKPKSRQSAFVVAILSEQPNLPAIVAAVNGIGRVLTPFTS